MSSKSWRAGPYGCRIRTPASFPTTAGSRLEYRGQDNRVRNMKRRWILSWLCIAFSGSTCLAADRLNVLFITVDDMNRDSVGVYGAKVPGTTPNIDRLASEGLRFEHAHVTVAICQPTRAVWMTGRYPHNSGALGFDEIRTGVPTLPETLRHNGFYTGILGKIPHVVPSRENAFEYRRQREEMHYGRSADLYGRFVAEFLREARRSDRPFFFMVNTDDPHRPFDTRKPASERSLAEVDPASNGKNDWYSRDFPAPSRIYQPDEIVVPGFPCRICRRSGKRSRCTTPRCGARTMLSAGCSMS